MTHKNFLEWMPPALEGTLSATQQRELETHLAECAGCRARWDGLQDAERLLRLAPAAGSLSDADIAHVLAAYGEVMPLLRAAIAACAAASLAMGTRYGEHDT